MKGRAGRYGQGTVGESIVMCKNVSEFRQVKELMLSKPCQLSSCLDKSAMAMSRVVLEAIASGMAKSRSDLNIYLQHTLLFHQSSDNGLTAMGWAIKSLEFLESNGFIDSKLDNEIIPTQLGSATLASSLNPEDSLFIYRELKRGLKSLVLVNEVRLN
jgi:DNA polymerase theta